MHGNTVKTDSGFKTRPFERVRDEIMAFFEVHEQMGTHPGGVHLEMTGQDATECTGGTAEVTIGGPGAALPDPLRPEAERVAGAGAGVLDVL